MCRRIGQMLWVLLGLIIAARRSWLSQVPFLAVTLAKGHQIAVFPALSAAKRRVFCVLNTSQGSRMGMMSSIGP